MKEPRDTVTCDRDHLVLCVSGYWVLSNTAASSCAGKDTENMNESETLDLNHFISSPFSSLSHEVMTNWAGKEKVSCISLTT